MVLFSVQGPRFPDPSLMGDQGPRPPMPTGFPGPPMDQTRMVYRQGAPSYGPGKTVKKWIMNGLFDYTYY